jgi:tRNA(Ile)-lysidine synthase
VGDAAPPLPTADDALLARALAPLDGLPLVVGFSGGLDSTVLLHALAARRARYAGLRALHVDHGLHAASADWAAHCRRAGMAFGVPVEVIRVQVEPRGDGPEAAARRARHAAFAAHLQPGEVLVLAHHRDDQAETVLLRLLRGASSEGLGAMATARAFGPGSLRRPLLDLTRAQLHAQALSAGLRWIDDPSNASQAFDRNHLRGAILPALRARWPQADAALATSARLLAEDAALLAEETARRLDTLARVNGALDVDGLLALPAAWRARALRLWCARAGLPAPPAAAHARIDAELLRARDDATPVLRWPGGGLRRWRDGLYLLHAGAGDEPAPADWSLAWDGAGWLALPDGSRLGLVDGQAEPAPAAAAIAALDAGPLRVASRQGGERLRLPGREHRHQLKHLLQDAGLPPWQRGRLPLLFAGDGELLAAGDALVGARLAHWCAGSGRRLHWARRAPGAD